MEHSCYYFSSSKIKKGSKIIYNSGSASMDGLPAAIGASFSGKSNIICIEGDGSLQMNIQELATVSYHKLPIKYLFFKWWISLYPNSIKVFSR